MSPLELLAVAFLLSPAVVYVAVVAIDGWRMAARVGALTALILAPVAAGVLILEAR